MNETFEQHPSFSIVRRLAVGGMGEVLLARFVGNDHVGPGLVVVKRTIPDHPNRDYQDQMLREEGRVALRLRHANLVETYAMDELGGHPLLVMELLAGRSMAQVLGNAKRAKSPTPIGVALQVLHGAACGLHFAHTLREGGRPLGLVHRDVSPANIFVTYDGKVKVIDFGVAKAQDSELKTSTGILKGKLGYMSPEHAKGETLDARADVWSLGVVLWESLVTDRLFGGQNPAMTLFHITQAPQDPPSARRPDVPAEVDALCMRLLSKEREQRFASCAEVVRAIEQLPPSLWRDTDVGAYLSQRFPDDAVIGQQELTESARMVRPQPIPVGITDGEIVPESDDNQVATLIADGRALVAQALALSALEDPPRSPPTPMPPAPLAAHSDEANKTVSLRLSDLALSAADLAPPASGHPGDTLADIPVAPPSPPPSFASPPPSSLASPPPSFASPPSSLASPPPSSLASPPPSFASPPPSFASPPPSFASPPPSFASPPPSFASPPPSFASPPPSFASPPPSSLASPPPSFASPPPSFASPPPSFASPPPSLTPRQASVSPPARAKERGRRPGPSSLTIGVSAFGVMAMLAGGVFGQLNKSRAKAPPLLVYQTADKLDAVVALEADARAPKGPLYSLSWPEPRLMLQPGGPREAVNPRALQRELTRAGIWQQALVLRTFRQQASALMPLVAFLLGLAALSLSLPAMGFQGAPRVALSAVLLVATSAGGTVLFRGGGLGWPGRSGDVAEVAIEPLYFQKLTKLTRLQNAPPARVETLTRALHDARLALLRGQPQEALSLLGPVATPTLEVPEVFALLGDANVDLGRDGFAEGHYLRYLELVPDAADRPELEAWLRAVH